MTKIILKSGSAEVFNLLRTPFSILLHPTVLAYDASRSMVYLADVHADSVLSRLGGAGVDFKVLEGPELCGGHDRDLVPTWTSVHRESSAG
jgi:hypothetical protein